jgi:uncharacterized membrane protein (Fun14 family)
MEKFLFYLEKNPVVALLVGFGIGYLIIVLSFIPILAALMIFLVFFVLPHLDIPGIDKEKIIVKQKFWTKEYKSKYASKLNAVLHAVPFLTGLIIGILAGIIS